MGRVDDCVALAMRPEVIFTTFGDAMRVPGSKLSLLKAKAEGADVRMVYSPLDALKLAQQNPQHEVIFFGLGFETTDRVGANGLDPVGAYGWSGAYSTTYRVDPEANLVICFMVQVVPTTTDIGRKFPTLVYQALEP